MLKVLPSNPSLPAPAGWRKLRARRRRARAALVALRGEGAATHRGATASDAAPGAGRTKRPHAARALGGEHELARDCVLADVGGERRSRSDTGSQDKAEQRSTPH
eukprot:8673406-Alexandrium_andersonii.AAC.1